MSRPAFMRLVAAWAIAVLLLLIAALIARLL
jgi:hypothetical protein